MARGPQRASAELRRASRTRRERTRILVATEGRVTEPQYVERLAAHLRATGVRVASVSYEKVGQDPLRVVKEAEKRNSRSDYDEVWCVFDVDTHGSLQQAIDLASGLGYRCAISNPCFEVWLIWHIADFRRHATSEEAQRELSRHGLVDKHLPPDFPIANHTEAVRRAAGCARPVPHNPGSTMGDVVEAIGRPASQR